MPEERDFTDPMPIPAWMIIDAVRYALGRRTYQVGVTCTWLIENWDRLPLHARAIIRRDLEEEFDLDDRLRATTTKPYVLGADMDRADWERVRRLWT